MGHVVTKPPEPFPLAEGWWVHLVPAATDNLVWAIERRATREVAIVDGPEAATVLSYCADRGLTPTTVLTTHTHGDHVGLHHDLLRLGHRLRVVGAAETAAAIPGLTDPVVPGDRIDVLGLSFTVLRTDGHLAGHVSYVTEGAVFCGDSLFTGGCGQVFDGPMEAMVRSLLRLAALPGETRVCCAHEYTQDNLRFARMVEPSNAALGDRIRRVWATRAEGGCAVPSTVEEERATNPFLRPGSPELIREVTRRIDGADPPTPERVFAATRRLKTRGDHTREAEL